MTLTNDVVSNLRLVKQACLDVYADYPVVAEFALAQAAEESDLLHTPSKLAMNFNNLFGIKGSGSGGTIRLMTHECTRDACEPTYAYFAVYKTLDDCIRRHRDLMENGTRDNPDRYKKVFDALTVKAAAQAVRDGGYATDQSYVTNIVEVDDQIKKMNL